MSFIIRANGDSFSVEPCQSQDSDSANAASASAKTSLAVTDYLIDSADRLLKLYVATDNDNPLYPALQQTRRYLLDDLDAIETPAEIYGLIHWLLRDQGIRVDGSSLEETADRLSDIDIAADSDQYTDIIFHLRDAVDRLYEMELDEI
ncbi:hypothetical protein EH243_14770 [Amphritea opalescens]|uniref:Uncharacterized protein n=2 Tax=Amphritea opalescens TaxID=2490544 RepID=A0A430KNA1_9GAMM|nr:hypothetical protein EH243_14770 [Amphritea opalescens]